ncbi:hypothetical protein O181_026387 [Austropuccinia psidii MF-1]|uniref:Uncharacterized protein n=1 Tax=Austropuccinia psidii MF-1 TaxID=1389203 RepID=A0A9Q3H0R0_9BASI|nr:hypothetical protein [Austropuccinia psidii MF-1]
MISLIPSSIDLSAPFLGHHPMVTPLLDWSKVIIWSMRDENGKRTFALGLIITMSCHPWDSKAKKKTHQIRRNKTLPFLVCLTSKLHGRPLQAQVAPDEPSQHNEPLIPGPSQASDSQLSSHENDLNCEPEPDVAPMQSLEEPFAHPTTPRSFIIIDNMPIRTPLPHLPVSSEIPTAPSPLVPRSPHSNNKALQEFTNLQPILIIPQAIVHKSINLIFLEHSNCST